MKKRLGNRYNSKDKVQEKIERVISARYFSHEDTLTRIYNRIYKDTKEMVDKL